ncbi:MULTISPECIES: cytochrome c oxidase subunit II [unclassified Rudaea]|uniref:cytochrome c oxidase subunit II n=1 Tax=unclassified Rudaea TaxID=2627037 RepID=UPI0010F7037A|nr:MULTISPECIES: cytochrome c oxidase subunit II [unclassified Rudaea]
MNRVVGKLGLGAVLAAGWSVALAAAERAPWQLNMHPGVTQTSQEAYDLHMLTLWICVVIGAIVFGAMFIAMFKFRKSKGAVAATWSHNTKAEILWTVTPILILVGMAYPATKVLISEAYTNESQMTVKITGYQWKWGYDYVNWGDKAYHVRFISKLDGVSDRTRQLHSGLNPADVKNAQGENTYLLDVDKPLVLPTNTKVRFVITGDDVIHSWWVPALGWKSDAIPGIINDTWTNIREPGIYRGQCAELCGQDHGFMPIVVKAVPPEEFKAWLDQQEAAQNPPAAAAAAAPVAQQNPPAAPSHG